MSRIRHWKQRFDPSADFVFTKRRHLGLDPENPWVNPGDPVPKEQLGVHRLKTWWRARYIALADWVSPNERNRVGGVAPKVETVGRENGPEVFVPLDPKARLIILPAGITSRGRGWYAVELGEGKVKKVRHLDKAKAALAARSFIVSAEDGPEVFKPELSGVIVPKVENTK